MDAKKSNIITLLEKENTQFVIPVYQRKYTWTNEQCNRLIDDIIKSSNNSKEHFTGTIVYQEIKGNEFKEAHLVDGQQRITTLMIILKVLYIIGKENNDVTLVDDTMKLFRVVVDDDSRFVSKLIPSENDKDIFETIMYRESLKEIKTNTLIAKNEDSHLYNNFLTIYNRFKKIIEEGKDLKEVIWAGLKKLVIIQMKLSSSDDPQEVFECINSLGIKLTNSDLIRNYLLMSNKDQKTLYEQYWKKIQNDSIGEDYMEEFIFNYIMMEKKYVINNEDIYKEYVKYAESDYKVNGIVDKEKLLKRLDEVARIYQPFLRYDDTYSKKTNSLMQELRDMNQTTAYPFLMEVFLDYNAEIIDEKILNKTLNLIITYLVRRIICKAPTHSLRGFMLNLYNRIFKVKTNKERYYEAIYAFLDRLETQDKLRSINETKKALKSTEIYKNVKFATYFLYRIENGRYPKENSEITIANNISVEHIMPQTLTDSWVKMLGDNYEEIHRNYLNTLGNLSLSSQSKNSNMSNDSFKEKVKILNEYGSKFNELNKDVICLEKFTEEEILARCDRLSNIVENIYNLEEPNTENIRFDDTEEFVCSDDYEEIFLGATPTSYKFKGREYPTDSYAKIIAGVATALFNEKPDIMRKLASGRYNPWNNYDGNDLIHYSSAGDKGALISEEEDIRVHTNFNAPYSVQFIVRLMKEFNYDSSQLIIYLKKDTIKTDNILPRKERIRIVRDALNQLDFEGKVIYNNPEIPIDDEWIKFEISRLKEIFPFDGKTKWSGKNVSTISYLEYNLKANKVVITYKDITKNKDLSAKISNYLGDETKDVYSGSFWHLKSYAIDYKKVLVANDKVLEIKKQIESILERINIDLDELYSYINN